MDTAGTTPIERIARVPAAHALSRNAEGDNPSAGEAVNALWPDHADVALAVLKALREPSSRMAEASDPAIWERMVIAAMEDEPAAAEPRVTRSPPLRLKQLGARSTDKQVITPISAHPVTDGYRQVSPWAAKDRLSREKDAREALRPPRLSNA
ncbi:hypothetical protein J2W22_001600 [Sphingomonas kyeonggiensis]|uniref:hypothetical protein n=1 Tax=Sphingomonas kyeonggiensis TaxID=1268553 RepID=UPI002788EE58|nr:hypothetical protein [Sphingomonas kyeonggiensis]MDQ0249553.1 hypothetical protein [Sphingomonas kyeonggiensis]